MVINKFFLVLSYSSFELICETIDGGVHILFSVIGVDRTTIYKNSCLGFVPRRLFL